MQVFQSVSSDTSYSVQQAQLNFREKQPLKLISKVEGVSMYKDSFFYVCLNRIFTMLFDHLVSGTRSDHNLG